MRERRDAENVTGGEKGIEGGNRRIWQIGWEVEKEDECERKGGWEGGKEGGREATRQEENRRGS